MHCFTEKERAKIHNACVELLKNVGVVFQDERALAVFKKHGIKVDGEKVFIEEEHIRKALETVPKQFEITARNPNKSVIIGAGDPVCAPGYGSPFIITETGEQSLFERAVEIVKNRIESYEKPDIDRTIEKQLSRFLQTKING